VHEGGEMGWMLRTADEAKKYVLLIARCSS
jgi:hypothetical protein